MLVNKYLQQQIDDKSKTRALSEKPNPKQVSEGSFIYVDGDGLYVKYKGELKAVTSSVGNVSVNTTKNIVNNSTTGTANSYSIRLSHIVEFFSQDFITISQQYGNITDSIKIPADFTKINSITCYVTVTDGRTLVQKYVDKLSGSMNVTKGNSLEIALKYIGYSLKVRVKEKGYYFDDKRTSFFTGNVILNNGTNSLPNIQSVYDNNSLVMFLEMLINVS